jgi:hypothetical protein
VCTRPYQLNGIYNVIILIPKRSSKRCFPIHFLIYNRSKKIKQKKQGDEILKLIINFAQIWPLRAPVGGGCVWVWTNGRAVELSLKLSNSVTLKASLYLRHCDSSIKKALLELIKKSISLLISCKIASNIILVQTSPTQP